MESKANQIDGKTNVPAVNTPSTDAPSKATEQSQPLTKITDSSAATMSPRESIASIKTDPYSEAKMKQQISEVVAKTSECSSAKATTESTAQIKRYMTVDCLKKNATGHILPESSSRIVQSQMSSGSFTSVVTVEPNAPSSVRLERGGQLHIQQPSKIVMDIWGVLIPYSFRNDLYAYIDKHLKSNIVAHLDDCATKCLVNELAKRTADVLAIGTWPNMPPVPMLPEEKSDSESDGETDEAASHKDKEAIAEAVVRNLAFRRATKDESLMKGIDAIYSQAWNDGYREKTLCPPLFPDVMRNLRKWRAEPLFIKMYSFAAGPPEIQELFLSASKDGDVTEYLTFFFDTQHNRYREVVSGLSEHQAKSLFYLTDSPKKGREACKAGLTVFIVRREGNKQYKQEDLDKFTVIDSLDQFDFF